jgi:hypothetical protein
VVVMTPPPLCWCRFDSYGVTHQARVFHRILAYFTGFMTMKKAAE